MLGEWEGEAGLVGEPVGFRWIPPLGDAVRAAWLRDILEGADRIYQGGLVRHQVSERVMDAPSLAFGEEDSWQSV